MTLSRRSLLAAGLLLPVASLGSPRTGQRLPLYPFQLGVASGDPTPSGIVLWTRLVQNAFDSSSLRQPISVRWILARDERLAHVVREGEAVAHPERAHAVHVEVDGLEPAREYWYQFTAGGYESRVGRTRTLPRAGAPLDRLRLAIASCQNYTDGYFVAYRDMLQQDTDLILHTGDYIYENGWGTVRRHPVPEAISLEDYRAFHSQYRMDPDLQAAHARIPWMVIWDDHEVLNDWGAWHSVPVRSSWQHTTEAFARRKAAAIRAYIEHMPLRLSARLPGETLCIHHQARIGDLLELNLLDVRQFRDLPPCQPEERSYIGACAHEERSDHSMLGKEQEHWLFEGFANSGARWPAIVQGTILAPFDYKAGEAVRYDSDGWDNYTSTRTRLLDMVARKKVRNAISLGGNVHAYYAGIVHAVPADASSAPLLCEFVTTSITATGGGDERYRAFNAQFAENGFARYFENRFRGYVLCDVTRPEWRATLRAAQDVTRPGTPSRTLATLTVAHGNTEIDVGA